MRVFAYISFAVALTGCASPTVKEFNAPDGTSVKTVKCTSEASK